MVALLFIHLRYLEKYEVRLGGLWHYRTPPHVSAGGSRRINARIVISLVRRNVL
jgi:hypothetical protein